MREIAKSDWSSTAQSRKLKRRTTSAAALGGSTRPSGMQPTAWIGAMKGRCELNNPTKSIEDMSREERKSLAAACSLCGGWTSSGGMSQFFKTPDGCYCNGFPDLVREEHRSVDEEKCLRCRVSLCSPEDLQTGICADCWTEGDGDV